MKNGEDMKIDRLLRITVFLLNREKVSAHALADKFEVSQRTIQRDIEALNLAGVPIVSTYGAEGGYQILDSFKMERQTARDSDYLFILTALKGLATAYNNPKIDAVLEKIISVSNSNTLQSNIFLDFGVLREGKNTKDCISLLESAISEKKAVSFDYSSAEDVMGNHEVEPIALTYKWYSWYLFAFSNVKKDYRLYKLIRMSNLTTTDKPFLQIHESADSLLKQHEVMDNREYIDIKLQCKAEVKAKAVEYFNGSIEKTCDNGDIILNLHLPENEHFWFGSLLAFGNKIIVLEPDSLKQRLYDKAKEILNTYQ